MTLISPRSRILLIAWHNAIIPISDIPISDNALKGFKWNRTDYTISQIWQQIELDKLERPFWEYPPQ